MKTHLAGVIDQILQNWLDVRSAFFEPLTKRESENWFKKDIYLSRRYYNFSEKGVTQLLKTWGTLRNLKEPDGTLWNAKKKDP